MRSTRPARTAQRARQGAARQDIGSPADALALAKLKPHVLCRSVFNLWPKFYLDLAQHLRCRAQKVTLPNSACLSRAHTAAGHRALARPPEVHAVASDAIGMLQTRPAAEPVREMAPRTTSRAPGTLPVNNRPVSRSRRISRSAAGNCFGEISGGARYTRGLPWTQNGHVRRRMCCRRTVGDRFNAANKRRNVGW